MNYTLMEKEKEKLVYQMIQEYLNKNRYLNITNLIPYIKNRFTNAQININEEGIAKIISSLIERRLIVKRSKLVKEDILTHPNRIKLFNYIKENPGVYFYCLVKELNISNHVVKWHLDMLLMFNFISKIQVDNHDIYFDANLDPMDAIQRYYLSNEKCKMIIEHLKNNADGGITKTGISEQLNMHLKTVTKYVKVLCKIGLIKKEEISYKTLYFYRKK